MYICICTYIYSYIHDIKTYIERDPAASCYILYSSKVHAKHAILYIVAF